LIRPEDVMTMKRQTWWLIGAGAAALALLLVGPTAVQSGQEEQFTPEFRQVRSSHDPKHTPRIKAPASVKRGQWFEVTVSVGADDRHPSLAEHFVRYIALYKDGVEISRAYLHPVFSAPQVTFTVALDEGGMLRALAEPTHSAAWEASRKIAVVP
jgi:superoxide reductase